MLLCKTQNLGAHNAGAGLEGEHCANEGLRLALSLHHGSDLNHGILVSFGKDSYKATRDDRSLLWNKIRPKKMKFCSHLSVLQNP